MSLAPITVWSEERQQHIPYKTFVQNLFKREGFSPLAHAAMGASGEAGELLDAIKKHVIYNKELDYKNVKEELGDMIFYMQALMLEVDFTWEEVVHANVEKLNKRYKEGYSDKAAQVRADKEIRYYIFIDENHRERKQYLAWEDTEQGARLLVLSLQNGEVNAFNPEGIAYYSTACWEAVSADGFAEYMQE